MVLAVSGSARKCKISTRKSDCIYVIVGLRSKPETGFDSSMFVDQACNSQASIRTRAQTFGKIVNRDLRRAMRYSRLHSPEIYARDYHGKPALEVIFAGFDANRPAVAVKSFTMGNGDVLHEQLIEVPDASGNNLAFSGEQQAGLAFLNNHPNWPINEYPRLARMLVESEIKDKPEHVGGPVDVLVIERTGHRGIAPYGTCGP
jgi:hypothetical protein